MLLTENTGVAALLLKPVLLIMCFRYYNIGSALHVLLLLSALHTASGERRRLRHVRTEDVITCSLLCSRQKLIIVVREVMLDRWGTLATISYFGASREPISDDRHQTQFVS